MIYVTGASGYLGAHIMRLLDGGGVAVPRTQYEVCEGEVVIHCAAIVPHNTVDAYDSSAAHINLQLVERILAARPRFLVFVSTRETVGTYALSKRQAETLIAESDVSAHVIRFPGLFGKPRTWGLAYRAAQAVLSGRAFQADRPLPDWTCMPVTEAAAICCARARMELPGLTVARNEAIENFLDWVRA